MKYFRRGILIVKYRNYSNLLTAAKNIFSHFGRAIKRETGIGFLASTDYYSYIWIPKEIFMKKALITILAAGICVAATATTNDIPRPEYPRPQFERTDWVNLNGEWTYVLDLANTGWERKLSESKGFEEKILVPFAPESQLSGVGYTEFIPSIWYQRELSIPEEWKDRDIVLHFGAVYYQSEIYIDGRFVARHFGGSDSFSLDITPFVKPGSSHSLVVNATSDVRGGRQPVGKQSMRSDNYACMYTRTTGIWQTVWMEALSPLSLERVDIGTDIDHSNVSFRFKLRKNLSGAKVNVYVYDNGKLIAKELGCPATGGSICTLPIRKAKLWSPESPYLYDVVYELTDPQGNVCDKVSSYFGMRKIHIEGNRIFLNNQPYYQRLVLDQGYYPDGIWTAPSDDALRHDIELGKSVGFNGARLHQKVFEERYYYWADKLGYLTWGESPSWGLNANDEIAARNFLSEWANIVYRDVNHPSLITWVPFNEEFWPDRVQYPRFVSDVYDLTKMIDPTRPVNTVSGGVSVKTNIWAEHQYDQDPELLKRKIHSKGRMYNRAVNPVDPLCGNTGCNQVITRRPFEFPRYAGDIPYILDEFGGILCLEVTPEKDKAWGYGKAPATVEEFFERLDGQVSGLLSLDGMCGYCYTQLTDVMQEQNGLFYFDRTPKYDAERLKAIFGRNPQTAEE